MARTAWEQKKNSWSARSGERMRNLTTTGLGEKK